jgi:hypothetical protein
MSSLEYFAKRPEIELVAATQQAEDEPSPTPAGISDVMDILNPDLDSNCFRIFCATKTIGLNLTSMFLIGSSFAVTIEPRSECICIVLESISSDSTVILLFIAHRIALPPYTIKCSPNRITLAGADAIDFN